MSNSDFDQDLSFELLEDILDLDEWRKLRFLDGKRPVEIGPLVELAFHAPNTQSKYLAKLCPSNLVDELQNKRGTSFSSQKKLFSLTAQNIEFLKPPSNEDDLLCSSWEAFLCRLKSAGIKCGLEDSFSAAVTATFSEMVDNVILHSFNSDSAIVGYRWTPGEIEYVVADSGIGVLESLRSNPQYDGLSTYEMALRTAVRNGESRYGRNVQHGSGFNLLKNIAKNDGYLRFRSGSSSLILNGLVSQEAGKITEESFVCSKFQGFLVYVKCRSSGDVK